MFWMVLLGSVVIVGLGFSLLAIRMLLQKNGKFPNIHIGGNKEMAKRGIVCATTMDKMEQKQTINVKMMQFDTDHESITTSC